MTEPNEWPPHLQVVSNETTTTDDAPTTQSPSFGGGAGGGGFNLDSNTRAYVDKSMDAVKAQNDARFAEVLTKLDSINVPTIWQNVIALVAVAITGIGFVFMVLAYASDRFDGGLSASSIIVQSDKNAGQIARILKQSKEQDARIDKLIDSLQSQVKNK